MIVPDYFEKFKCIGGVCSDSCCIGWDIDIDKKSFRQYHKTSNQDMKKMFQKYVHNNQYCTDENIDYGRIKLPKDKRCPFLDDENYCIIYKNLGEEALSCVCTHFPRTLNIVDNVYEMSLDLACPEVSRIVLNKEEGIKFKEIDKKPGKHIVSGIIDTKENKDNVMKFFKEIRKTSIDIIQNRKFTLSERLFMLGNYLSDIDELSEESLNKVEKYISSFNFDKSDYEREDINYILQISFLKKIVDDLNIIEEIDNVKFKEYTKEILKNYNLNSDEDLQNNAQNYLNAYITYTEEFINKDEYIFENYLVNSMYNNLFPFSDNEFIFDGYMMLLIMYSLIRFYLVGKYINSKVDSKDEIINFIQNFVKAVEHDKNYRTEILENIRGNYLNNMEFAKILI